MAALSDAIDGLSIDNADFKKLGLIDNLQTKLNKIKNNFETIFSWEIKEKTGIGENLLVNLIDKVQEKIEVNMGDDDDVFNLYRFYLQLIVCYELYTSGSRKESLFEIQSIVKYVETCKFDKLNIKYLETSNHIARATNAYIALTLDVDFEKTMEFVKPVNHFSKVEKAAINVIKARVFMEYPPKGNDEALKFAKQACDLHPTDSENIITWLKAKGRVRRYNEQYKMPTPDELNAAQSLCSNEMESRPLIEASKLYKEAAFAQKLKNNKNVSNNYYKMSSELTMKAVELANDNVKLLNSCLMVYIDFPKEFQFKTAIDGVIQKLTNVKNSRVDQVLGKYYLKHEKNYEKAKLHLSRGMAAGDFCSSLQLIKVECLIKPVEEYPLVQSLNMIYDVFNSPKRRLIILSQILMYYYYYENNPKEIMHYLKLYMDQNIDDTFKRRHLIFAYPLFKFNGLFRVKQFLYDLAAKVEHISKLLKWNTEEKVIVDNTFNQFKKLLNKSKNRNQNLNDDKTNSQKQNCNKKSYRSYPNKKPHASRKNNFDTNNTNHQQQSMSKNDNENKTLRKTTSLKKIYPSNKNKETENISKGKLSDEKSKQLHEPSIDVEKMFNKFKNQSSFSNIHIVSKSNNSTHRPRSDGPKFERKDEQLSELV